MKHTKSSQNRITRRDLLKGAGVAAVATTLPTAKTSALAQDAEDHLVSMRDLYASPAHPTSDPGQPSLAVIALNRLSFGPRPNDIADFLALGSTDEARLAAYVAKQLDPDNIDDSDFENRVAVANFETLDKSLVELWADHVAAGPDYNYRMLPIREIEAMTFNRALHSKRQLVEVLADFWHNHFNVYGWDYSIGPVFVHYDRDVIRTHLLGNFRTMLEEVAKSTAMLYYLDNRTNSGGTPNENYARELFELHAMGAENYLGVIPQDQVPTDGNGPVAYVDDDVYGATTCFTGWTVNTDTGEFLYESSDHFPNQKVVFGVIIPANQAPMKDGQDVLDMLVDHPGTGRYIARKLCRRFISDNPPNDLVNQVADIFTAQKDAPDQLKQVIEAVILSDAFRNTWGEKIKRPLEMAMGSLRALNCDHLFLANGEALGDFSWYYDAMGQALFNYRVPTGYPDEKEDWLASSSMLYRWRLGNWITTQSREIDPDTNGYWGDVLADTPADIRTSNELVNFWTNRILGRSMASDLRQIMLDFMAQGRNPDYDLPLDTDSDTQERLRTMVSLILNSPDFQWR